MDYEDELRKCQEQLKKAVQKAQDGDFYFSKWKATEEQLAEARTIRDAAIAAAVDNKIELEEAQTYGKESGKDAAHRFAKELKEAQGRIAKLNDQVLSSRYIIEGMEMGKSYEASKEVADAAVEKRGKSP